MTAEVGTVNDFMPTLLQVCGAGYPAQRNGVDILPAEGESLVPTFQGKSLVPRPLYLEHEGNRMIREGDWKLVALASKPWELYNLTLDPTEVRDLSAADPARVEAMNAHWEDWAESHEVKPHVDGKPGGVLPANLRAAA